MVINQTNSKKITLLIVIISFIIIAFLFLLQPQPKTKKQSSHALSVSARKVFLQNHSPEISLFGVVASKEFSELSSPLAASVLDVLAHEGQRVRRGDLLVQLDERQAKYSLAKQLSNTQQLQSELANIELAFSKNKILIKKVKGILAISQKRLNRQEELRKNNLSSDASRDEEAQKVFQEQINLQNLEHELKVYNNQIDISKAKLAASIAQEDSLKLELSRLQIKAPFSGVITQIEVAPGEHVSPGQLITAIYNTDKLQVISQIPENYLHLFQTANQDKPMIRAQTDDKKLHLRFAYLGQAIESGELGQKAYFNIENPDVAIQNDQVILNVSLPKQVSMAVPKSNLYGNNMVYKIKNNALQPVDITYLGQIKDAQGKALVLIKSAALTNGSLILNSRVPNARAGLKVQIKKILNEAPQKITLQSLDASN